MTVFRNFGRRLPLPVILVGVILLMLGAVFMRSPAPVDTVRTPAPGLRVARSDGASSGGCAQYSMTITIKTPAGKYPLRITSGASDTSVKEAIAAATGLRKGDFGLKDAADGVVVAVSAGSFAQGATYETIELKAGACPYEHTGVIHQVSHGYADPHGEHGVLDNGIVLTSKPAKLPRVVVACLGTGRYRPLSLAALVSVREHFGGDSLVSLHLLTDNITGVDKEFNARVAPYREWPLSGLAKFEDILNALTAELEEADYFYFVDGDVRFHEDVLLADVSGDLVAVEHPMYPRHEWGWCVPNKITMCEYPYERKSKSTAYIPDSWGKWKKTLRTGEHIIMANSYYLQSAFWGGKTRHIIPMLKELKKRVDIDIAQNYFSSIIQDERYVNWYFWKHTNDSRVEIRWLSPSYLYPYRSKGFGHWVKNASRPIIIHGTAKAGKMIIGEHEIRVNGVGGKKGTCFDTFLGDKIGTYACHDAEYVGGTQGFVWLPEKDGGLIRTTETIKLCVDGGRAKENEPVKMAKCRKNDKGQLWTFEKKDGHFVNQATGLCMDSMRFDRQVYPKAAKDNRHAVFMQPCGKSKGQKLVITVVDVMKNAEAADKLRAQGKY